MSRVICVFAAGVGGLKLPKGPLGGHQPWNGLGVVHYSLRTYEASPDLQVTIEFDPVDLPHVQVLSAARAFAESLVVNLAYLADVAIGPISHVSNNLRAFDAKSTSVRSQIVVREPGVITVEVRDYLEVTARGPRGGKYERTQIVGEGGQAQLAARLQQRQRNGLHHRLYRVVMQSTEPVARFLLLYMLLETLRRSDSQRETDAWIRRAQPGVPERVRLVKDVEREVTIYTWIRNELVHSPTDSEDLGAGRQEAHRHVDALTLLVKQAIEEVDDPNG